MNLPQLSIITIQITDKRMENSAQRYGRILKAQNESSTNAPASGVPLTPPKTPPSKNGISKPTRRHATKTSISARMEKRLEEEGLLNTENILDEKKKLDILSSETIVRFN